MKKEITEMLLNLGRVEEREDFSFQGGFGLETEECGTVPCRAEVKGSIARRGGRIFLQARVESKTRLECSRCLEPFELRLDTEFDLVFHRESRTTVPDGMEEEDFILLTETIERRYDIFPRVRESILLELPIRFLCRDDCKGLCSNCGADLNKSTCSCTDAETDPRWDALKKLLSKEDQS
jgi:uncharacterized protein